MNIIGPETGHKYHPDSKAEINRRIDAILLVARRPLQGLGPAGQRPDGLRLRPRRPQRGLRRGDDPGLARLLVGTAATLFLLHSAQRFFIPLLLGVVMAYTLNPLVAWLERQTGLARTATSVHARAIQQTGLRQRPNSKPRGAVDAMPQWRCPGRPKSML